MKSKDLDQMLYDVLINDEYKTILIDGPWGCGKTTSILNVVKQFNESHNSKINKIKYKSLFGIKDIGELASCFTNNRAIGKAVCKTFFPALSFVPLVGPAIVEGLNNVLDSVENDKNIQKDKVFIFDDLERTDDSFSYKSFLGLINELVLRKCKIICIASISDLKKFKTENINKRVNEIEWFKEKAFDRIITINESPVEIYENIFSEHGVVTVSSISDLFADNIRIAKRTKLLMDKCLKNAEKEHYKITDIFSNDEIMKAALCTIRTLYNTDNSLREKAKNELEKGALYNYYDENRKEELSISKQIKLDLSNNSTIYNISNEKIYSLCDCMIDLETHNSFDDFRRRFPASVTKELDNPLMIESFYYLNDEGRLNYFKLFKDNFLNNKIKIDPWFIERLFEIKKYSSFDLDDGGFLNRVINAMVETDFADESKALYNRICDYKMFKEENFDDAFITSIIDRYNGIYRKKELLKIKDNLDSAFCNSDYLKIIDFLYDLNDKRINLDIDDIKTIFVQHDFYLPDLSLSMIRLSWSLSHELARFAQINNLENEFIVCLEKQMNNNPKEQSLKDKCLALIEYNHFSKALIDELKEKIKNSD